MSTRSAIGLAVILVVAVMYLTGTGSSGAISKVETTGVATLTTNSQITVVNHVLGKQPSHVSLQPMADTTTYRVWISDINATSFKINFDQTNVGSPVNFMWKATE